MCAINIEKLTQVLELGSLALGNFDGVHLGHQSLLSETLKASKVAYKGAGGTIEAGGAGALTFLPHPQAFFEPQVHESIYSFSQNAKLIKQQGIKYVLFKSFDEDCSKLSAKNFMDQLFEKVSFKVLVVGFDFRLGKDQLGTADFLNEWCLEHKVVLKILPCQSSDTLKISSTRIKKHLKKGEVEEAGRLLGGEYFHMGNVSPDQGLGGRIGFPTLNLRVPRRTAICKGVYCTEVVIGKKRFYSISNIGFRPTVSTMLSDMVLESYILDKGFKGLDNESSEVKVVFKKFIRNEQKFDDITELKAQITKDVETAKSYFSTIS